MRKTEFGVVRDGHLFQPISKSPWAFRLCLKENRDFEEELNRDGVKKGKTSEELFLRTTSYLIRSGRLPGVMRVRRASRVQDQRQKIDFFLDLLVNDTIRPVGIQVKSSVGGAAHFMAENPRLKVHVIVMNGRMNMTALLGIIRKICAREMLAQ